EPTRPQHIRPQSPPRAVLPRRRGRRRLPEVALVERRRPLNERAQPLPPPPPLLRPRILVLTAELHAVAVGQHLDGRREVEPLGRLHELDRVPRPPAAEAVKDLLLRA